MNAKELIESATRLQKAGIGGAAKIDDVNACVNHILSTVRQDDDEPVTRERLEADGWFTHERFPGQFRHDEFPLLGLTQSGTDFRIDDHGRRLKSIGHLRRLVAALGE